MGCVDVYALWGRMWRLNSIPVIRVGGAVASALLCLHSCSFLFSGGSKPSLIRLLHNVADVIMFAGFGFSGLVAEIFPRDSATYKILKSNIPVINSLVARGVFYLVLGCVVMGDFTSVPSKSFFHPFVDTTGDEEEHESFWGYFTVLSGIYIALTGAALVWTAVRARNARSLQTAELTQPIVAFVPSSGVVERSPQIQVVDDRTMAFATPV